MLKIGEATIGGMYIGDTPIKKAFLGTVPLFDSSPAYPSTLEECTWAQISKLAETDSFLDYYAIGDTKTIVLNGQVGNSASFDHVSIQLFVIGVNHNAALEGNHRIHFQLGKISSVLASLVDGNYISTVSKAGYFSMNASNTNSGGWSGSQMRAYIMGAAGTPVNPVSGSLMAALPSDLRAVMKPVTKYTNNVGGTNSDSSVTATTEYLCLPAEYEYYGKRTYSNSEFTKQAQYQYYKTGGNANKVHHQYNLISKSLECWFRSPRKGYTGQFCNVDPTGYENAYDASRSLSIAPILFV